MVGEDCIERSYLQAEDVIQIVQMVKVLSHKVLQAPKATVTEREEKNMSNCAMKWDSSHTVQYTPEQR